MNHLDLFAGIGGFSLAASWMGWKTVAQVEWDKWCQKVLAKNFPDTLRFGDIVEFNKMLQNEEIIKDSEQFRCDSSERKEKSDMGRFGKSCAGDNDRLYIKERIGHINIITGGFPCQPFSHAGKRKGTDDSRYLWPEMLTTIRILKPSFVIGENVAGLVSMENGKTLDRILADLENEGYTTEQFIIPASAIGAWHKRERIWITAYANGFGRENEQKENKKPVHNGKRNGKIEKQSRNQQQCRISEPGALRIAPNSYNPGCEKQREQITNETEYFAPKCGSWWKVEPGVGRVADGIPNRVDRLKGLGNAIVPQVAYEIFKAIELLITSA